MPYLRKQTLQLASKGRFLAAQFIALLEGDLWRRSAAHANAMAARLAGALVDVPGVRITQPVQANAVFAVIPPSTTAEMRWRWSLDTTGEEAGALPGVFSWETTAAKASTSSAVVSHEHIQR